MDHCWGCHCHCHIIVSKQWTIVGGALDIVRSLFSNNGPLLGAPLSLLELCFPTMDHCWGCHFHCHIIVLNNGFINGHCCPGMQSNTSTKACNLRSITEICKCCYHGLCFWWLSGSSETWRGRWSRLHEATRFCLVILSYLEKLRRVASAVCSVVRTLEMYLFPSFRVIKKALRINALELVRKRCAPWDSKPR